MVFVEAQFVVRDPGSRSIRRDGSDGGSILREFLRVVRDASELLRQIGLPYSLWERKGVRYAVVAAHCDYFKPARYDEELTIKTRIHKLGEKSIKYDYGIERIADNMLLAEGYTVHVFIDRSGKSIPAPLWLRKGLSKPKSSSST